MLDMFVSDTPEEQQDIMACFQGLPRVRTRGCCRAFMDGRGVKSLSSKLCNPASGSSHRQMLMHLTSSGDGASMQFPVAMLAGCLSVL